jgi:hypothetical protein
MAAAVHRIDRSTAESTGHQPHLEADMRIRPTLARVAAAGALAGAIGLGALAAAPAGAAPGQTAQGITLPLPLAALQPFMGPAVPVPSNCGFDANALFTITGNGTSHGVQNKNGNWGGQTFTGIAVLTDPGNDGFNGPYTGQATGWGGGGTNIGGDDTTGQLEGGQTFHFHGTNGTQSLDIVFDWHYTQNDKGVPTAINKIVFTCS